MADGAQALRVVVSSLETEGEVDPPQPPPPHGLGGVDPVGVLRVPPAVGEVTALEPQLEGADMEGQATTQHRNVLADVEATVVVGLLPLRERESEEAELTDDRGRVDESDTGPGVPTRDRRRVPREGHVAVDLREDPEPGVIEVIADLGINRTDTRPGVVVPIPVPATTPDQEVVPHQVVRVDGVAPELEGQLTRVILPVEEEPRVELVPDEAVAVGPTMTGPAHAKVEEGTTEISDPKLQVAHRVDTSRIHRIDTVQAAQVKDLSPTLERQPHRVDQVVRAVPGVVVVLRAHRRLRFRERRRHEENEQHDHHGHDVQLPNHDFLLFWLPIAPPQAVGRPSDGDAPSPASPTCA